MKARGRRGGRAGAAPIGEEEGGPPWRARASVASLLSCFFFSPFALAPPPRAPALPRTTSGVRTAAARAWYARVCVCVCCVPAAALAQAGRVSTAPGTHPLSPTHTSAPPPRSRPSPPHSQRLHHPHSHTHPSSLHTTPTPLFRVPAPPCAPSSTPTRPAFRPTPARPTVWAPRAPSPSWCPPAP